MKKYQIIYADPPWSYRHCASNSRQIKNQYNTMPLNDIKKLKIPCEDNSLLYLWATAPKLQEALEVMIDWGFDYRTCMVWDKEIIGMGYWFRGQHELLLVGVKGKFSPPEQTLRVSSVLKVRRGKHSRKPDRVRYWINKWYPDKTKIELFAREKTEGWDVWGNEVEIDINLDFHEELEKKLSRIRELALTEKDIIKILEDLFGGCHTDEEAENQEIIAKAIRAKMLKRLEG